MNLLLLDHKLTHESGTGMIQPGFAALGAVAVAAVGVWGVFKMAMAVAEGTGRTLNSSGGAAPAPAIVSAPYLPEANDLLPMQPAVPSGPVYPPSPQHRKVPHTVIDTSIDAQMDIHSSTHPSCCKKLNYFFLIMAFTTPWKLNAGLPRTLSRCGCC